MHSMSVERHPLSSCRGTPARIRAYAHTDTHTHTRAHSHTHIEREMGPSVDSLLYVTVHREQYGDTQTVMEALADAVDGQRRSPKVEFLDAKPEYPSRRRQRSSPAGGQMMQDDTQVDDEDADQTIELHTVVDFVTAYRSRSSLSAPSESAASASPAASLPPPRVVLANWSLPHDNLFKRVVRLPRSRVRVCARARVCVCVLRRRPSWAISDFFFYLFPTHTHTHRSCATCAPPTPSCSTVRRRHRHRDLVESLGLERDSRRCVKRPHGAWRSHCSRWRSGSRQSSCLARAPTSLGPSPSYSEGRELASQSAQNDW